MTTEVYKKLKKFESKMSSAVNSGYARFRAPELEEFSSILVEHRGAPLSRQERTCPRCLLTTLKNVAADYFKFQSSPAGKKLEKLEREEQEVVEHQEEENNEEV